MKHPNDAARAMSAGLFACALMLGISGCSDSAISAEQSAARAATPEFDEAAAKDFEARWNALPGPRIVARNDMRLKAVYDRTDDGRIVLTRPGQRTVTWHIYPLDTDGEVTCFPEVNACNVVRGRMSEGAFLRLAQKLAAVTAPELGEDAHKLAVRKTYEAAAVVGGRPEWLTDEAGFNGDRQTFVAWRR